MEKHFLQSNQWKKFQQSLGKSIFEDSGTGWSFLATLETTPLGRYLYVPYGPTVRNKKALEAALKALQSLAEQQGAVFIRIEPTAGTSAFELSREGFVKIKEINPEHTWVLDLTQSKTSILAGMKQNNRNLFNTYKNRGISIHHTTDPKKVTVLTSLLSGVAAHNHINTHSSDYLAKQMAEAGAILYYVTRETAASVAVGYQSGGTPQSVTTDAARNGSLPVTTGQTPFRARKTMADGAQPTIAAALVYDSPTTRYYAHAAASYEHRKLSAGTALLAQMIIDAKNKGLKTFDFYGITSSEDPHHPWYGFTKFKKSFGGQPLAYLGTWDLPIKKARYRAFNTLRRANRRLRKLLK
jgi:lipid II:glycine glycyltransferase (peptidoglycan interpeptide bridge formation enzyme)